MINCTYVFLVPLRNLLLDNLVEALERHRVRVVDPFLPMLEQEGRRERQVLHESEQLQGTADVLAFLVPLRGPHGVPMLRRVQLPVQPLPLLGRLQPEAHVHVVDGRRQGG